MATAADPPAMMRASSWKVKGPTMTRSVVGRTVATELALEGNAPRATYSSDPPGWCCSVDSCCRLPSATRRLCGGEAWVQWRLMDGLVVVGLAGVGSAIGRGKDGRRGATPTEEKRANGVVDRTVGGHGQVLPGRGGRSRGTTATVVDGDGDGRAHKDSARTGRGLAARQRTTQTHTHTHTQLTVNRDTHSQSCQATRFVRVASLELGRGREGQICNTLSWIEHRLGHCAAQPGACRPCPAGGCARGGRADHLGRSAQGRSRPLVRTQTDTALVHFPSANNTLSNLLATHCTRVHTAEKAVAPVVEIACREMRLQGPAVLVGASHLKRLIGPSRIRQVKAQTRMEGRWKWKWRC